tara:strand:- start:29718 stop:29891 length:174 start_codon:yes stop_codon:yes gene_type:complete
MKTRSILFVLGIVGAAAGAALLTNVIRTEENLARMSKEHPDLFNGLKAEDIQIFKSA